MAEHYFLAAAVDPHTQAFSAERFLIEANQVTNFAQQVPGPSLDLDAKNTARPTTPGGRM